MFDEVEFTKGKPILKHLLRLILKRFRQTLDRLTGKDRVIEPKGSNGLLRNRKTVYDCIRLLLIYEQHPVVHWQNQWPYPGPGVVVEKKLFLPV